VARKMPPRGGGKGGEGKPSEQLPCRPGKSMFRYRIKTDQVSRTCVVSTELGIKYMLWSLASAEVNWDLDNASSSISSRSLSVLSLKLRPSIRLQLPVMMDTRVSCATSL
jgi:hypothetical protein